MKDFHDKSFDDATQLKLALFREYIRKWLPVFLTQYTGTRRNFPRVNIYDFFAGPGRDAAGNPGSPMIIVAELFEFFRTNPSLVAKDVVIHVLFNDVDDKKITELREAIGSMECPSACHVDYSVRPFCEALRQGLPEISAKGSANLVIMDQCGVKDVTPEVIRQLAECNATDLLFFISSSYIKRFIETPELGGKFDMAAEEVKTVEYNAIHRHVCSYFRQKLAGADYYLSPFSIKKGSNIYGVVFGTSHLLGLEKFLDVCWSLDEVTGEANYNIDGDFSWHDQRHGQRSMFPQHDVVQKLHLLAQDVKCFVADNVPDNRELYRFCLTHGLSAAKSRELLRKMQDDGELIVTDLQKGCPARKGAFYLRHEMYKQAPRATFTLT